MSAHVLHRERVAAPRIAIVIAAIAGVLIVVDIATGFALKGWGVVAGPLLLIVAATFWGLARYSAIRLTPARLIVGRAGYAPDDFDLEFGVRTVDALTDEERALVESPMPISKSASVQLAGGSWGRPAGSKVLVLRLAGSANKLALTTQDADRLGPLLGEWLLQEAD